MKWKKVKNDCGKLVREDGKYTIQTIWSVPYHFEVRDEAGKVIESFNKQKDAKLKYGNE